MTSIDVGRQWIVFPRWDGKDGFQHYKNRDPVWIKNYTRLTSSDEYLALSFADRGLLHGLWLEYARSGRALTRDTASLGRRLGQRVLSEQLERLNQAGFLTFSASKPLAPGYHDASPEKRREDRETPLPPSREGGAELQTTARAQGTNPRAKAHAAATHICPRCGVHFKAQTLLDEHLYTSHDGPEPEHWKTTEHEPETTTGGEDPDLPPPEERARIAAELRASLTNAHEIPRENGVVTEDLPWEGDAPPALT